MKQLLWRLDYLCIEIFSKNIKRYTKVPKEKWRMRYSNDLGERIILACLSNSFDDINENTYDYILNNFSVRKFYIFPMLHKKVEYFDFLNGKHFDELEIQVADEIRIKNEDNFQLTADKLNLKKCGKNDYFARSRAFFMNLFIQNDIRIKFFDENTGDDTEMEELLLFLLDNTSIEIEKLKIYFERPTNYFIEEYTDILIERNNIKTLHVTFYNYDSMGDISDFFLRTSVSLRDVFKSECIDIYEDLEDLSEKFDIIEKLGIRFNYRQKPNDKVKEYFHFLRSIQFKNLKKVCFNFYGFENYPEIFEEFLKKCPSLEILDLDYLGYLPSLFSCSKTLKSLSIYFPLIDFSQETEEFKQFLYESSIQEIKFDFRKLSNQYFFKILKPLEVLRSTLTSLTISCQKMKRSAFLHIPSLLQRLNKLQLCHINNCLDQEAVLCHMFKSLQSSSESLEDLNICSGQSTSLHMDNSNELFQLLRKCNNLTKIKIEVNIQNKKFPEFLSILTKFQSNLEEINICWVNNYHNQILEFLSGCRRLTEVSGFNDRNLLFGKVLDKKIIKSLINSKYSLRSTKKFFYDYDNFNFFPYILMNKK